MIDKKASLHLSKDPIFKKLFADFSPHELQETVDIFQDVVETILGQQLSGKAADTIINRFKSKFRFKKNHGFPSAKEILKTPDQEIRDCGVSWAKIKYIKSFCEFVESGKLDLNKLDKLSDEEVVVQLIQVKGIGKWTAEMILIFTLKRPDVFSLGDLGLRTAVAKHYGVNREDLKKIEKISRQWSPHRSLASRYLWESLNNR